MVSKRPPCPLTVRPSPLIMMRIPASVTNLRCGHPVLLVKQVRPRLCLPAHAVPPPHRLCCEPNDLHPSTPGLRMSSSSSATALFVCAAVCCPFPRGSCSSATARSSPTSVCDRHLCGAPRSLFSSHFALVSATSAISCFAQLLRTVGGCSGACDDSPGVQRVPVVRNA